MPRDIYAEIDLNGNKITGLGTPSADTDAATKAYVDQSAGGGGATMVLDYLWYATAGGTDPGTGRVGVDTSSPASAFTVLISATDADSIGRTVEILALSVGNQIRVDVPSAPAQFYVWQVSSAPVNRTTHIEIPVTNVSAGTGEPTTGTAVTFTMPRTVDVITDHGSLGGRGDDDHTQYGLIVTSTTAPASPRIGTVWVPI